MEKETLYKFYEGTASLVEEEAIRAWMEASDENKRLFFKERRLYDAMLLLGDETKQKKEIDKRKLSLSSLRTEFLKIAAVVAITLGGTYLYQQFGAGNALMAMQTISVPAGQRVNVTLPDGTNVWLNARTTIKYPISFNADQRQVVLDGEAYFDVAKNKKIPFVVHTDKCDVEVLGTKFNIDAYSDRGEFETTLMEGSVKVASVADPSQTLTLAPDSKVLLKDGRLTVVPVDDYNPYRWKEGLICFRNESFVGIMKDFEKYYGINIQVKNKDTLQYFYTGKFRQTDGIDYALRVLQKDIRFTYKRDDENHIIYIE